MDSSLLPYPTASQSLATPGQSTWNISRVLSYFARYLTEGSNYVRIVRRYLEYCLEHQYGVDAISAGFYCAGKKGNVKSPIKKFIRFAKAHQIREVIPDAKTSSLPPAANAWVLAFLTDSKTLRGQESARAYQVGINAFFAFLTARELPLGGYAAEQFVRHLKAEGKSVFTINHYLSCVKQFISWLLANSDRTELNLNLTTSQIKALADVASVKGLKKEGKFYKEALTESEREQLLSAIPDVRGRAMVSLMAYSGLRSVEVVRLEVEDIDWKAGILLVLGKGKHTKERAKFFNKSRAPLREYLATMEKATGPLFPGLTTGQIRYHLGKYLQIAGLRRKGISAHSLRHTAAQLLLKAGARPVDVQYQLRHSQFETTQFYVNSQIEKEFLDQLPDPE